MLCSQLGWKIFSHNELVNLFGAKPSFPTHCLLVQSDATCNFAGDRKLISEVEDTHRQRARIDHLIATDNQFCRTCPGDMLHGDTPPSKPIYARQG